MSAEVASLDDVLRSAGLLTLGDSPPAEAVETVLRNLGEAARGMDRVRREALRAEAVRIVKPIGWRAAAVDHALGGEGEQRGQDPRQGRRLVLESPEPWPDAVDGATLLDELAATYRRHLAQPDGAAEAEALWTLHAHAHDAALVSPLLCYASATKRCGKTTALSITSALVPRPLASSSITGPGLFRTIEAYHPTLLVDEADTFLAQREELRGLLNSGHTRSAAAVVRCEPPEYEPRLFSTWAPKAVALIGELADTLKDRSVEVRLTRRRPDERVERVRLDRLATELAPLRSRCARWALDHLTELREADPAVPRELNDRAADNWRALLAIADLAGGVWPERARRAALLLAGTVESDGDVRVQLLADLHRIMDGRERLASADAVRLLVDLGPDCPWSEWRGGRPLTERQLARLLAPYGVRPSQLWHEGRKIRGYDREQLADVWARYTPTDPVDVVDPNNGAASARPADSVGEPIATEPIGPGFPRRYAILPAVPDQGSPQAHTIMPDELDDYEREEREAIQWEAGL